MAGAGQDVGESLWRHAVTAVQQAFAALVVSTFVYHFLSLGVMGRTPGQALTALCVVRRRDSGRPGRGRAGVRAAMTTLVDVGWYALACCLLAGGAIGLSVLCWVVAVAFFAFNAALALVGSRRSPADRLGGVTVTSTWRVPAALTRIGGAVRRRGAAARCSGAVRRRGQPDYLEPAEPTPPASRRGRRRATR
ncbi:RDD family protein [Streptomyces lonegramiae]|uniref:RDD family protein n=1 Tax=Streptomyces lonegramiae TaxID=3075524 RepID=A0ABU2XIC6_9ACTN|nr:RDD family protein [Streptomyces sp. DSM 41529]MDT0545675.1 RDD family protein [Streptomyces sp. DSM 41529]